MCLAYPMKVEHIDGSMAQVSAGAVRSTVNIQLIRQPKIGDYVLVHAGIAIEKINRAKAQEILVLIADLEQKMDGA